jgi:RND family efflux transporter MFP subunit
MMIFLGSKMERFARLNAAAGLLLGLSGGGAWAADLEVVPAARAELPRVFRLDGVAEAINRGTISAQTSGRVLEVNFDVDDYVRAGDVIVRLDDTEQQARVDQAEAELRAASVARQDVENEHKRISGVFAKQAVSKAEMDKTTAARNRARAAEQAAAAALAQARQQLEYTRIRAPYNGIVTERHIEIGEIAQPGTQLMSGLSLDSMRVSVNVPQNLVASIREQQKAQAQIGDKWVAAEEITVFPVADPRSDTFEVRLRLPEGVEVFPGMYVKVGFVTGVERRLVIPLASVVMRSEVVGVYVIDAQGKVFFRHVRLGSPAGSEHVSVLSGLDEGEQVATDPIAAVILLKSQRMAQTADE